MTIERLALIRLCRRIITRASPWYVTEIQLIRPGAQAGARNTSAVIVRLEAVSPRDTACDGGLL